MAKRHVNYFRQLKEKYPYEKMKKLEAYNGEESVMEWTRDKNIRLLNFFETVLPSLCSKYYDQSELFKNVELDHPYDPDNQRFLCMFDSCLYKASFATRQVLVRHLQNIHSKEIPLGGSFLTSKNSSENKRCQYDRDEEYKENASK